VALGSHLLLIPGKSTRQGDCQAIAAVQQIQFDWGLAGVQLSSQQPYISDIDSLLSQSVGH